MKTVNVILSGGIGSRLWPLSRKNKPKQYLPLFGKESLFQLTVKRNKGLCDSVLILGNIDNLELSRKSLESLNINDHQHIIEAVPRNTAAAIALACLACDEDTIMLVTPSDHIIKDEDKYNTAVNNAISLAEEGYLVTFGINPIHPEVGYGYIEYQNTDVLSFREKPDRKTAEDFLQSGKFMWNSGMFCFKAKTLLQELISHDPELFDAVKVAWDNKTEDYEILERFMKLIPSRSIDYSVMEKSKKIKMVKSEFYWSDLGSFDYLCDYLVGQNYPVDDNGNMFIGKDHIHTEFVGLKNTLLVYTKDDILILNKENSQDIRYVYEKLEKYYKDLV